MAGGKPTLMTVSLDDPMSVRAWSGTTRRMTMALSGGFSALHPGGPVRSRWLWLAFKVNGASRRLFGRETLPHFNRMVVRDYARCVQEYCERYKPDVVFAPVGAILLDGVPAKVPIVYASDATVRLLFDYYPAFTNVNRRARKNAESLERRAIDRADALLYSTHWAANSAIREFGANPAKILVSPYGANLDHPPSQEEVADAVIRRLSRTGVNLLLVGVNWRSKGCDIAVACLRALRGRGHDAKLTVIGCAPPQPIEEPGLTVIPFLDKSWPDEAKRFNRIFLDSDFLILPSRNECSPIALCEAFAFGVPSIATATGGIPEIVRDGVNGFTLPLSAEGADYADVVERVLRWEGEYERLARESRRLFEQEYNWDVWGARNLAFIRERLA